MHSFVSHSHTPSSQNDKGLSVSSASGGGHQLANRLQLLRADAAHAAEVVNGAKADQLAKSSRYYKKSVTIMDVEQLGGTITEQLAELFEVD